MSDLYLKQPQLRAELEKCLQCKTKPCMHACPVECSPRDFIAYAKTGDFNKAAEEILRQNPLGEVCGLICPDKFCMKACLRANIDNPIKIPAVQAAIMRMAREMKIICAEPNGKKIAVIGLGPAGMGAVFEALKNGFAVDAFEKNQDIGGALNLIPQERLPHDVLLYEWQRIAENPLLNVQFTSDVIDYQTLTEQGYDAIIVAVGEQKSRNLNIEGEEYAVDYTEYLKNPQKYISTGHVMIIGGGAAAVDCALTAVKLKARHTEMLVRRSLSDMRITTAERESLLKNRVDITTMTRPTKIVKSDKALVMHTIKTEFNEQGKLIDVIGTETARPRVDLIVKALGTDRANEPVEHPQVIYAGDFINGSSTAVEAIASGKRAIASIINS